jgi:hypothetical protein
VVSEREKTIDAAEELLRMVKERIKTEETTPQANI